MISSIDPDAQKIGSVAAETLAGMMESGIPERMIIRQVSPSGVIARASSETTPVEPAWLADALVYIQRNAKHGISASDVFAKLNLSHTLVTRVFGKTLGVTVCEEIARTRLEEARRLLSSTDLSVTQIAKMSGFNSTTYFMQSFSKAYGTSPGAWRTSLKLTSK